MFFVMKCIGKECWAWWCIAFSADDGVPSPQQSVFFLIRSLSRSFGSKWAFRAKFMAIDNEKEVEISSRSSKICAISRFGRQFNALWGWCGFFKILVYKQLPSRTHPMWIFSSITLQWFIGRCHVKCWKSMYTCCLWTIARYFRGSPFLCLTSFEKRCHKILPSLFLLHFSYNTFLEKKAIAASDVITSGMYCSVVLDGGSKIFRCREHRLFAVVKMETEQWHSEQRGFTLGWTLFLLLWELQVDFHLSILNTSSSSSLVVDCNSLKHTYVDDSSTHRCFSHSSVLELIVFLKSCFKFNSKIQMSPWGLLDVQMRITILWKTSSLLLLLPKRFLSSLLLMDLRRITVCIAHLWSRRFEAICMRDWI